MIKKGRISEVPDVANNDLVRRIAEQRVTAKAQLASDSRTLLPGHPRIQELVAQIADLDDALRGAADQTVHSLENEARIAGNRVANLESVLNQQKKVAGVANVDEVHLHELERIAEAYKDQLEGSAAKYQEAVAREDSPATPADARIISRAVVPTEPSYPKKIPLIVFATLATFIGTSGWIISKELLSGRLSAGASRFRTSNRAEALGASRAVAGETAGEPWADMPTPGLYETPGDRAEAIAASLARHIAARSDARRSICIVTARLTRNDAGTGMEVALGRNLSQNAHAIILDLDGQAANFAPLFGEELDEREADRGLTGLTDLLRGDASFAEVIYRDNASQLHYIPAGYAGNFSIADFDLALAALTRTYDFIILMAPPFERNETIFLLAAHADFLIVSAGQAARRTTEEIKRDLIDAGAKDVIIVNERPLSMPSEHQDVA